MSRITVVCLATLLGPAASGGERIDLRRVPRSGIQPQVAVGDDGVLHLVYYRGPAVGGDLYYAHSSDAGKNFSRPVRVNSEAGSAIAAGTIRGAQIALGKRLHVAWNGRTRGDSPQDAPMLYTHLKDDGTFELQRNVMTRTRSLDGGGSVAADRQGNVYVVWHAVERGGTPGEGQRAVWVARSTDGGKSFAPEVRANVQDTGACGCCGLKAFADRKGDVFALYRTATNVLTRDMHLLVSRDRGEHFQGARVDSWSVPKCVMSLSSFAEGALGPVAAWETKEGVSWGRIDPESLRVERAVAASNLARGQRKHPSIAAGPGGEVLLAWTEGTAWKKGGGLAWQLYDRDGKPVPGASGSRPGIAVWSFPAVFATKEGEFVLFY